MVTVLFLLGILCGLAIAAFSFKLFSDSKKGVAFMGITLSGPKPAIAGMVLGALAFLCLLVVFLSLSGSVSELDKDLDQTKGKLKRVGDEKESAEDKAEEMKKAFEEGKTKLTDANTEINKLQKELKDKEASSTVASGDVERSKEELNSVRQKLTAKKEEAEALATDLGIEKARVESLNQQIGQIMKDVETEKQFRRDFMALVEEEEAAPSGTVRKVLYKLLDLKNKYK